MQLALSSSVARAANWPLSLDQASKPYNISIPNIVAGWLPLHGDFLAGVSVTVGAHRCHRQVTNMEPLTVSLTYESEDLLAEHHGAFYRKYKYIFERQSYSHESFRSRYNHSCQKTRTRDHALCSPKSKTCVYRRAKKDNTVYTLVPFIAHPSCLVLPTRLNKAESPFPRTCHGHLSSFLVP